MHCIWQAKEGLELSAIIRDFKKFTSKKIIKLIHELPESRKIWMLKKFEYAGKRLNRIENYKFWKDSNHAIELTESDTTMKTQKLEYLHNNPVKAMLVKHAEDYLFSSAVDYAGGKGMIKVKLMH